MFFSNKGGVSISINTIVKIILLLAFLFIAAGLIFMVAMSFSNQGAKKYSCWLTSELKASGNKLSTVFPDTCSVRVLDDTLDMKEVSILLRDTWWARGHGLSDFSILQDILYEDYEEAARFKVSEEISIDELLSYLLTHRKGKPSSMVNSDYNYLQEEAVAPTVCFDSNFEEDDSKFKMGQDYHLYFADHVKAFLIGTINSDRLIIMKGKVEGDETFSCYNPLTKDISTGEINKNGWIATA